jgi:hypothetical protein
MFSCKVQNEAEDKEQVLQSYIINKDVEKVKRI